VNEATALFRSALGQVVDGASLSAEEAEATFGALMEGGVPEVLISALLVALRMRGETEDELLGAARALRARMTSVPHAGPVLLDTCGTGGDGAGSLNVSTAVAFVVASAGVPVAKHGNRAVSSRAGSADVLEALGVRVDLTAEAARTCLEDAGIAFLFAPAYHPAMRFAAPVRRALGLRTLFNLVGPLANPAPVTHQILGVYDPRRTDQMARVLGRLGLKAALVVHGTTHAGTGLDEIAPSGLTTYARLEAGLVHAGTLDPSAFGLAPSMDLAALEGGDAHANARRLRAILRGEERSVARDTIVLNAAAALDLTGVATSLVDGAQMAGSLIDAGAPWERVEALATLSTRIAS